MALYLQKTQTSVQKVVPSSTLMTRTGELCRKPSCPTPSAPGTQLAPLKAFRALSLLIVYDQAQINTSIQLYTAASSKCRFDEVHLPVNRKKTSLVTLRHACSNVFLELGVDMLEMSLKQ